MSGLGDATNVKQQVSTPTSEKFCSQGESDECESETIHHVEVQQICVFVSLSKQQNNNDSQFLEELNSWEYWKTFMITIQ